MSMKSNSGVTISREAIQALAAYANSLAVEVGEAQKTMMQHIQCIDGDTDPEALSGKDLNEFFAFIDQIKFGTQGIVAKFENCASAINGIANAQNNNAAVANKGFKEAKEEAIQVAAKLRKENTMQA